ncbi:Peroxisomal membrane protein PAS20 [Tilletia horrida]|uniref:Peroxisomal membrane protein PEX13 n=1 Tax=Tilletia horrida TaxID=155126 RepID=A0AAN6GQR3_9BASI|nr:Peroxisomal membrane protein PAS20 [Tilletia horrida]KAK0551503.1 Peroxisomal membrane protein PAS20 [Tilletia horrida]KAK0566498.1 Peroxisomal membrane protein PAS20 [Tilletia horrida]
MPSPPKPWESAGAGAGAASSSSASTAATTTASTAPPVIPDRPSTLASTSSYAQGTGAGTGYGGLGSTYGGLGGTYGSSYSTPYSRMGAYGSMGSMYGTGGFGGGYGSMYGGYGSSMYGGGGGYGYGGGYGMGMGGYGMGGGMMGGPGMPGDPSLTQRMESGTQATFELIGSIVGAFGGFAQMLESTFMATHSSFFAMVGVADQVTRLGQVLSLFTLAKFMKNMLLKVTGQAPAVDLDAREFADFTKGGGRKAIGGPGGQPRQKHDKRPMVIFFLAVVGLPYLMGKLVKIITKRQEEERARLAATGGGQFNPNQSGGMMLPQDGELDPSKLAFVRALYAYNAADPLELSLKPNEIVAVLSKHDPSTGQESQWWRGRTRDGRIGWFPSTYVESVQTARDRAARLTIEAAPSSALPAIPTSASVTEVSKAAAEVKHKQAAAVASGGARR